MIDVFVNGTDNHIKLHDDNASLVGLATVIAQWEIIRGAFLVNAPEIGCEAYVRIYGLDSQQTANLLRFLEEHRLHCFTIARNSYKFQQCMHPACAVIVESGVVSDTIGSVLVCENERDFPSKLGERSFFNFKEV